MNENIDFLEKVSQLFYLHGAKSLTMDDIAREFSMSKKTLYQQYKNKEDLITEVLQFILNDMVEQLSEQEEEDSNPIANMICREKRMEKFSESNKSVFVRQLSKYYPALFENHLVEMDLKISEIIIKNINRGREMDLYRKDFNAHFYSKMLLHLFITVESSVLFDFENSPEQRCNYKIEIMNFFLHSIVTEKGTQILNNYK